MSSSQQHDNDPMKPSGLVNPIDTDYQVGQDNVVVKVGPFGLDIHNRVFCNFRPSRHLVRRHHAHFPRTSRAFIFEYA